MDGGLLPEQKTENIKNPSCMNISVHTGGISSCVIIVGILITVSKQYQICFEMPLLPVFTGKTEAVHYSHSIVPTGLGVKSINTRLMPSTSAVIRAVILLSTA